MVINLDKNFAIPFNKIEYFKIFTTEHYCKEALESWTRKGRKKYYVSAYYTTGNEPVFTADTKEECIDWLKEVSELYHSLF